MLIDMLFKVCARVLAYGVRLLTIFFSQCYLSVFFSFNNLNAKYTCSLLLIFYICHSYEGKIWRYIPKLLRGCEEHAEMCLCNPKCLCVSRRQNNENRKRCSRVSTLFHSLLHRAACKLFLVFCIYFILLPILMFQLSVYKEMATQLKTEMSKLLVERNVSSFTMKPVKV